MFLSSPQLFGKTRIISGGGGLEPETIAWIAAVVGDGGTVSSTQETRINNLVVAGKAHAWFAKSDRISIAAGESSRQQMLRCLKTASAFAETGGTGAMAAAGYTSDGASYIESNYIPSSGGGNMTQDSAFIAAYIQTSRAGSGVKMAMGALSGAFAQNLYFRPYNGSNLFEGGVNDATFATQANAGSQGFFLMSRTNGTQWTWYKNDLGAQSTESANSTGLPTVEIFFAAGDDGVTPGLNVSDDQMSCWVFGGGLDATEAANLMGDINAYMTAWGVSVY